VCQISVILGLRRGLNIFGYISNGNTIISHFIMSDIRYVTDKSSGSAIAEGPRDVHVSRNSATTKYRYRVALFA